MTEQELEEYAQDFKDKFGVPDIITTDRICHALAGVNTCPMATIESSIVKDKDLIDVVSLKFQLKSI